MAATNPAPTTESTPTVVTATELAKNLSDILNRVKYKGERFEVRRNGEIVVLLGPRVPEKIATMGDLIDFFKYGPHPDDEWADDMEKILEERPLFVPKDYSPWPD